MSNTLYWMVTIIDRNQSRKFLSFLPGLRHLRDAEHARPRHRSLELAELFQPRGNAEGRFVRRRHRHRVVPREKGLETTMQIDVPGTGIAFIVPLSSIGGKRQLQFLTNGQSLRKGRNPS